MKICEQLLLQFLLLTVNISSWVLVSALNSIGLLQRSSSRFKEFSLGWLVVGSFLIWKKEKLAEMATRCIHCHSLYHSLSFLVTLCHTLSFVVTRCTTRCYSLSLDVTLCHWLSLVAIRCHSLSLVVPLAVIRCHSLSFVVTRTIRCYSLSLDATLCHSLPLVVPLVVIRCHSLSFVVNRYHSLPLDILLVCIFINDP